MANSRQQSKPQSQIEKFREAAKELEADESEERFDRVVGQIARFKSLDKPDNDADDPK